MTEHDPLAGSDTYDVLAGLRPGEEPDRAYAKDVADWCERELRKARETGNLETRPFVQNAVLIIVALREYAAGLAGAVSQGSGDFRDMARDLPRNKTTLAGPPCHPNAFWTVGGPTGIAGTHYAVCSVCGGKPYANVSDA